MNTLRSKPTRLRKLGVASLDTRVAVSEVIGFSFEGPRVFTLKDNGRLLVSRQGSYLANRASSSGG